MDGVSAGVTVTLGTADSQTADTTHTTSYAAGQTVEYYVQVASTQSFPGFDLGLSVELESDANCFGVTATSGTYGVNGLHYAGALGNGYWASLRTFYSINALAGSATRLMLRRFSSPTGGSFKAWLELDGVLQDGTGGTVDTSCEVLDSVASGVFYVDFDLPCPLGQHLNVVLQRLGTEAAFSVEQCAAGIAFTPTTPNQFMCCGGSNDAITIPGTSWKWNHSEQEGAAIENHEAPVGQTPITVLGLYVEHSSAPGVGDSYTDTLLDTGVATALSVVVADAATSGLTTGSVNFVAGDLLTLELVSTTGATSGSNFYWGLAAEITTPPTPEPPLPPGIPASHHPNIPLTGSQGAQDCLHGSTSTITLSGSV